jgi:serine protease Do
MKMEWKRLSRFTKVSAVSAAVTVSLLGAYGYAHRSAPGIAEAHAATLEPARTASVVLPNFAEIVAQHGPAVVNISVSGKVRTAWNGIQRMPDLPKFGPDEPFGDLFKRFRIPAPRFMPQQGQGSGFIVTSDGLVLTNAHVVADAEEVTVKLTDRREFKAKVVGVDRPSDVAVLRIDAQDLPTVKLGDPQRSRVGDWVVAIGSPFGFENSVTAGIISAKSRSLPDEGVVPILQTNVAINPGNSGGPLFNLNGEVIGINSQIYSQSGGYQGLSFAIPIDVAMKVERQLVDNGKVSRGRLGVMIQPVDQSLAESFGLDKATGALVGSVEKGSAAEKAGIEPGDVILKFNGKEITRSSDLPPLVADVSPGTKADIEVWRKNARKALSVAVGERIDTRVAAKGNEGKGKLGIAVRPLTKDERKEAEVDEGLLVEDVNDGPAARAGIQPGDVILSVNGEKIASAEQLRALVDKKEKRLALQILREDRKIFVPIKLG